MERTTRSGKRQGVDVVACIWLQIRAELCQMRQPAELNGWQVDCETAATKLSRSYILQIAVLESLLFMLHIVGCTRQSEISSGHRVPGSLISQPKANVLAEKMRSSTALELPHGTTENPWSRTFTYPVDLKLDAPVGFMRCSLGSLILVKDCPSS